MLIYEKRFNQFILVNMSYDEHKQSTKIACSPIFWVGHTPLVFSSNLLVCGYVFYKHAATLEDAIRILDKTFKAFRREKPYRMNDDKKYFRYVIKYKRAVLWEYTFRKVKSEDNDRNEPNDNGEAEFAAKYILDIYRNGLVEEHDAIDEFPFTNITALICLPKASSDDTMRYFNDNNIIYTICNKDSIDYLIYDQIMNHGRRKLFTVFEEGC